ncbi:hypothetical protein ScPMuIL_002837 [Solemya velum]
MIFMGFAFLYTFLKRYGYSGTSFNFLLGAIAVQWAILARGLIFAIIPHGVFGPFPLDISSLVVADFNAATVLISFGAVIGKCSPLQLIVMLLLELVFANVNEYLGIELLQVADIGGSMFIHAFGAYFGMAVSRVLFRESQTKSDKLANSYTNDLFSLAGTVFLWCFWPSFNGVLATDQGRMFAIINTYFSLAACVVVTVAISSLVDKHGKLEMVYIQNATLAGGVVVGTTANMPIQPWLAMLLGSLAGLISTIGYRYLSPSLEKKLKLHDPAGVNNLHGMPGILGGLGGVLVAFITSFSLVVLDIFPAMAPVDNSTLLQEIHSNFTGVVAGMGRTGAEQGGYQLAALVLTLVLAIVGGIVTGFVMRLPVLDPPEPDMMYNDADYWHMPDEEDELIKPSVEIDVPNSETRMRLVKNEEA